MAVCTTELLDRLGRGDRPAKGDRPQLAVQPKRGALVREDVRVTVLASGSRTDVGTLPPFLHRHHGADSGPSLRVAVLAPIAWRTPPRHYGPWEQFASLLTEGLVAAGHDVTLFATADSLTTATLHGTAPDRLVRGPDDRSEGRRVPPHRRGVRAGRRVRRHPQRLRLPPAHVQRARRHAGGHDDPRVLVAPHRAGLRAVRRDHPLRRDQRRRPTPRPALRRHDPPRHRHRRLRRASLHPETTCCSSVGSTPTRARLTPSRSRVGAGRRSTSPASSRTSGTSETRSSRTSTATTSATSARSVRRRARRRARAAPTPCST